MESIGEVIVVVAPRAATDAADRGILSTTAAWALGLDPASVRVARRCPHCGSTDHGVPYLEAIDTATPAVRASPATAAPHPPALSRVHPPVYPPVLPAVNLSLSRAGGYVAVAVSFAGPVGVDIESVDAVNRAPLADVALSPRERATGAAGLAADLAGLWCAKEAILKSTGDGLRVDPRDLTLAERREPGFGPALDSWPGAGVPLDDILLASFDPGTGPGTGLGLVGRVAVLTNTAAATRTGTRTAPRPTLRLVGPQSLGRAVR